MVDGQPDPIVYALGDVRHALDTINSRGRFQYNARTGGGGCSYALASTPDTPACIAGAVVFELDPDLFRSIARSGSPWLLVSARERFTLEANDYLVHLQEWADSGVPWRLCTELVNARRFRFAEDQA